jgi:hypothetical protein
MDRASLERSHPDGFRGIDDEVVPERIPQVDYGLDHHIMDGVAPYASRDHNETVPPGGLDPIGSG